MGTDYDYVRWGLHVAISLVIGLGLDNPAAGAMYLGSIALLRTCRRSI